ncbi:MAG: transketolase [Clostridia bacterium]|nr:transketolase [Clostridia bacterium]MDR3645534.1 transketolase [Clostridia bacterium]
MDASLKKQLKKTAVNIRKNVIEAVYSASSGHPGGSLSIAEVLAFLYFKEMKIDPKNPKWPDRDRFVLSKGHCSPGIYSALALRGYFPLEEIKYFRQLGHILQGHPDMRLVPGVDMSSGSLGQGISAACGMALSAKVSGKSYRIYAVMGDGELEEGQCWEAAMFAAHYKLDKLIAWIDFNGLQIDGKITDVMSPVPIPEKYRAFGWNVIEVDAHNFDEIEQAYAQAKLVKGKPTAIVAHSIKGKGVSFMENNPAWHGSAPNAEQYAQAMKELDAAASALEAE